MRELLMDTKTRQDQEGRRHTLDYYVLVDELRLGESLACESYGVRVAPPGEAGTAIPNITTSLGRIDALMELLTRNFVTPTSLAEVVEDWL